MSAPAVYQFFLGGDDSRPMRVVITEDNDVTFEEAIGRDALGVQRWDPVDFDEPNMDGHPLTGSEEWAAVVALAVHHGRAVPS